MLRRTTTAALLTLCVILGGSLVSSVSAQSALDLVDVDGDGVNTTGDQEVFLWWMFSGGDWNELFAAMQISGETGLYDLRSFFESGSAQITDPSGPMGGGGAAVGVAPPDTSCEFLRGDANYDDLINVADADYLLAYLFSGGPPPPHMDGGDFDDNGALEVTDAVGILNFLFSGGVAPSPPYPAEGLDPTVDGLGSDCDEGLVGLYSAACEPTGAWEQSGLCWLTLAPDHKCENSESTPPPLEGTHSPVCDEAGVGDLDQYTQSGAWYAYAFPQWNELIIRWNTPSSFVGGGTGSTPPVRGAFGDCIGYTCDEVPRGTQQLGRYPVDPRNQGKIDSVEGLKAAAEGASVSNGWEDPKTVAGHSKKGIRDINGVDWTSGEYSFSREYLHLPGRGMDYSFSLTYRSYPRFFGGSSHVGANWDHYYFQRLTPWVYCDEDGQTQTDGFIRIVEGQVEYYIPADVEDLYVQVNEGYNRLKILRDAGEPSQIVVRTPEGMLFAYEPLDMLGTMTIDQRYRGGHLQFIRDRHGNQITCEYGTIGGLTNDEGAAFFTDPQDQARYNDINQMDGGQYASRPLLTAVYDTLGRKITYEYDLISAQLQSVEDDLGREVTLNYAAPNLGGSWPGLITGVEPYDGPDLLLTQITGPGVTQKAPNDTSDFTAGKSMQFFYGARYHHDLGTLLRGNHAMGDPVGRNDRYSQNDEMFCVPLLTHIYAEDGIATGDEFCRIKYEPDAARVAETLYGNVAQWDELAPAEPCDLAATSGGAAASTNQARDWARRARGSTTTYIHTDYPGHSSCDANVTGATLGPVELARRVTRVSGSGRTVTANIDVSGSIQSMIEYEGRVRGGLGNVDKYENAEPEVQAWQAFLGVDVLGACPSPCGFATYYERNEKGQVIKTAYPGGNCKVTEYDPIVGKVTRETLYSSSDLYKLAGRPSAVRPSWFVPTEINPSGPYITLSAQEYDPLFAQVIEETDVRSPSLVDPSYWSQQDLADYHVGFNNLGNDLVTYHYLDYEADGISQEIEDQRDDFALPNPADRTVPAHIMDTTVTAGNVICTQSPNVAFPGASADNLLGSSPGSGTVLYLYDYLPGGNLRVSVNPEGLATVHTYYTTSHAGGSSYTDSYPMLYGRQNMLFPLATNGGWLHQTIEADTSQSVDRGVRDTVANLPVGTQNRVTTLEYDVYGNVNKTTDPLGRETCAKFNELNQVYETTDALGFKSYTHYDELNKVVLEEFEHGATDWDGNRDLTGVPLVDDGTGLVDNLRTPDTFVKEYKYDYAGHLVAESHTYRVDGTISEYEAKTWLYFYNLDGELIQTVDPMGNKNQTTYDGRGLKRLEIYSNNPDSAEVPYLGGPGFPEYLDAGSQEFYPQPPHTDGFPGGNFSLNDGADYLVGYRAFGYDENKNLTCEFDAAQQSDSSSYHDNLTDLGGDVTYYLHDSFDRHEATVRPNGVVEASFFDPAGNVVGKTVTGDVLDPTDIVMGGLIPDQPLSQSRTEYDQLGRPVVSAQRLFTLGGRLQGGAWVTTESYLDRTGIPLLVVDPLGNRSRTELDALGRPIRTATAHIGPGDSTFDNAWSTTELTYDAADRVLETRVIEREGSAPQPAVFQEYYTTNVYDDLDRVRLTIDTIGQAQRMRYDTRGAIYQAQDARGPIGASSVTRGSQTVYYNDSGNLTTLTYDRFGRPTRTEVEMRWSDFPIIGTTITGSVLPLSPVTGDASGALHERFHPTGGATHADTIETWTGYDRNDNVEWRKDDNDNKTEYKYDPRDRLIEIQHPVIDGESSPNIERFAYDRDGLLYEKTDENGTVTRRWFDSAHREVKKKIHVAAGGASWEGSEQHFTFDGLNRVVHSVDENDPALGLADDRWCARVFDSLGRVTEEHFDGVTEVYSGYDAAGNKTSLDYPGLSSSHDLSTITFDRLHRLTTIEEGSGAYVADYVRAGGGGRVLERVSGDAVHTAATYDALGRMDTLQHGEWAGTGTLPPKDIDYEFEYNRSNHRVSEKNTTRNRQDLWSYDSANRLVLEIEGADATTGSGGEAREYWLDGVGNWKWKRTTDLTTTTATDVENQVNDRNQYTDFDGVAITHDAGGNRTAGLDGLLYTYDGHKRLIQVDRDTGTGIEFVARYEYFADHRRARKIQPNDVTTTYTHDGDRLLERTVDDTTYSYIYGGGLQVLSYLVSQAGVSGVDRYHLVEDALGSVVGLYDDLGNLLEQYQYSAYGEVTFEDATGAPYAAQESLYGNDVLYASYLYEPGVDHYWLKFRVYDPNTGKFLTTDPIGVWSDAATWGNGYGYAGFNPIWKIDLLGLHGFDRLPPGALSDAGSTVKRFIKSEAKRLKDDVNGIINSANYGATAARHGDPASARKAGAKALDHTKGVSDNSLVQVLPVVGVGAEVSFLAMEYHTDGATGEFFAVAMTLPLGFFPGGGVLDEAVDTTVRIGRGAARESAQALGDTTRLADKTSEMRHASAPNGGTGDMPDFVVGPDGTTVPVSQGQMREGFDAAGFPSQQLQGGQGVQHTLPDGSRVRTMEPQTTAGGAGRRASFENANGQPIDPTTGKPPQPPKGMTKAERKKYVRERTHVEQKD